ncbi:MAG: LacI family DNA-binding transcriptional regulator, partial [Candidatus Ornithospirochaeta sp.]
MATIKDIAEKSGVSRGTVDRVLHDRGRVDPAVREKVLEIAKELSYRPDRAGQALATKGKKRRISVVMPSLSNPFFLSVKKGMEVAMEENDMSLSFFHYNGYGEKECMAALDAAVSSSPDSLLLTLPDYPDIVERVEKSGIPFASVNSGLSSSRSLFYSGPDYTKKGRINAGLLAMSSNGFVPRILVLRGSALMKGHKEILEGFRDALDERGIQYSISLDVDTEDDDSLSFRATKEAL